MRAELFLSHRYITKHKKQSLSVILVTALFISALVATWIYMQSYEATQINYYAETWGSYHSVVHNANLKDVDNIESLLKEKGSGAAYSYFNVDYDDKVFYVGYIDQTAVNLLPIKLKEGRYPENAEEVTVENSTYVALGLNAAVGESVSVPVIVDGKTVVKEYTLVGITENYLSALWYDEQLRLNPLPTLLTADKNEILKIDIVCGTRSASGFFSNYGNRTLNPYDAETVKNDVVGYIINIGAFLFGIVIIVTVFGIVGIYVYTLRERRKYMSLLRCIGLKRYKGVSLFFIQGMVYWFISAIIGGVFGIVWSYVFILIYGVFGKSLIFTLTLKPFILAWIVSGITSLIVYTVPSMVFFKKAPLALAKQKHKRSKHGKNKILPLPELWNKSLKKEYGLQNTFSVILTALCVIVAIFGFYVATSEPRNDYNYVKSKYEDYQLYLGGGTNSYENFDVTLPRNQGVLHKNLLEIYQLENVEVLFKTSMYMNSQYVLCKDGDTHSFFENENNYMHTVNGESTSHFAEALNAAGGDDGDVFVKPWTYVLDYEHDVKNLKLLKGSVDKNEFVSGDVIIAPDDGFEVGDKLVIMIPVAKDGSSEQKTYEFDYNVKEVTVAATYSGSIANDTSGRSGNIIFSAEYLYDIDPMLNYSLVKLKLKDGISDKDADQIREYLEGLVMRSQNLKLTDYATEKRENLRLMREGQVQIGLIVIMFVIIISITIAISSYVKLKTNMHSYILMRSIGAKGDTIKSLIKEDIGRLVLNGTVIGTVIGLALVVFSISEGPSTTNTGVLFGMFAELILIVAAVFVLIYFAAMFCIKKQIKHIAEINIASAVNSVDL